MSGHSKWANIKHKTGTAAAARGKTFSKIAKEIMVAARSGGNPADNITLRALIQKAKAVNMPNDNIDRAVKKGTGELEGGQLEEGSYECYAAGGIAVVVKVLTDNKNRSASEVRHAMSKAGTELATPGSVSRMFQRKGQIFIDKDKTDEVNDVAKAQQIMKFVDALEALDDVQDVYTNFDISDEIAAQLDAE
jgi:YebC/PmpR family DNA-binding regulatory protein